jgi:S-adenosylmethionine:tRNA ribosyltransferase-isomerase
MKTGDFFFDLPARLIAQYPPQERGQSRLMTLDRVTGKRSHRMATDLPEILCAPEFRGPAGSPPLLVFNDSRVRKARLIGKSRQSGAEVEFLLLETIAQNGKEPGTVWKAMTRKARRKKLGSGYVFYDGQGTEIARAEITGEQGELRILQFEKPVSDEWLERYGHIPLPPYIKREDVSVDAQRYQTIYARAIGSAAAPTAGFHFTRELLDRLAARGIESAFVTLHVGPGTFLPVRSENIEDHVMHEERFVITGENADRIEKARAEGRRIIAVGTTSVRTLESAWDDQGRFRRGWQSTSIFIYPGYQFRAVDALFTNFHTPGSTLLMLVSAFADGAFSGRDLILESYAEAIREGYRFFSYGDAMLIG